MSPQEPLMVHWLHPGDRTVVVIDPIDKRPIAYPACVHPWCPLPVGTMVGSPMKFYGLGTGWTTYECREGHRYAYQPQGGEVSHYGRA